MGTDAVKREVVRKLATISEEHTFAHVFMLPPPPGELSYGCKAGDKIRSSLYTIPNVHFNIILFLIKLLVLDDVKSEGRQPDRGLHRTTKPCEEVCQ